MNIIERMRLDGKKALVTGAGQGLGKAFALALAEAGTEGSHLPGIRDFRFYGGPGYCN